MDDRVRGKRRTIKVNVTIIGGAGRMGRWLIRHFLSQKKDVTISDVRFEEAKRIAESYGVKLAKDNQEAVKEADLIVISTPIRVTPDLLREIAPSVKKDAVVSEISSLKSQVVPILTEMAKQNVKPLSIHPLFGPGAQKLEEERIALIPVVDPSFELKTVENLFPGAEVIVVDAEEHDRAMALTLSLPHFLNMIFASVIGEEDLNALKKLGGTTFTLQLTLSESVMNEDPLLYSSIQMNNEYTVQYLNRFLSKAEEARDWIIKKDEKRFSKFYYYVQGLLSRDEDFYKAYERMYRALEAL